MNITLLFLRLVLGAIFLAHGLPKRKMWNMQPSEQMSASMLRLMKFLSVVEPLGGIALILGFLTPFAAAGVGLIMIGAIWLKVTKWHTPFVGANGQTGWEFDLTNLAMAVTLFLVGGGQIAIDFIINK